MGLNIRKSAEYSNNKIIFDYSILWGKFSYDWKKKNPTKSLSKECPGKIVDLTKIDHWGNTSSVCV